MVNPLEEEFPEGTCEPVEEVDIPSIKRRSKIILIQILLCIGMYGIILSSFCGNALSLSNEMQKTMVYFMTALYICGSYLAIRKWIENYLDFLDLLAINKRC
jgi:hypothetical protein